MKNVALKIQLASLLIFLSINIAFAGVSRTSLNGTYENVNITSESITKMSIITKGEDTKVGVFGACGNTTCDWGTTKAMVYTDNAKGNINKNVKSLVAYYRTDFKEVEVFIFPKTKKLITIQTLTRYTDGSGRSPHLSNYTMTKTKVSVASTVGIGNTPTGNKGGITKPNTTKGNPNIGGVNTTKGPKVSRPTGGTKRPATIKYPTTKGKGKGKGNIAMGSTPQMDDAGRDTPGEGREIIPTRRIDLKWEAKKRASFYIIEFDRYNYCATGKWCSDLGKMYRTEKVEQGTSYTSKWAGYGKARWRVVTVFINDSRTIGEWKDLE